MAAIQASDDPIKKLDAEYDKRLQDAVRVFNLTKKSADDRANLAETLSNIEIGFEKLVSDATIKIAEDTAKKLKEINESNAKDDLSNTLATIDLTAAEQKLKLTQTFKEIGDFSKEASEKLAKDIAAIELNFEIAKQQEIIKSDTSSAKEKIDAQQKILDLVTKSEGAITDITIAENEKRLKVFQETFNQITDIIGAALSSISTLTSANTEQQISQLQEISDAQLAAIDVEEERLNKSRSDKLISEKEFETNSAALKQKRIATEKKIADEIKEIKRKQALLDKEIAILNIILNTARGITAALASVNIPLSIVVAAIGAIELATAIATPLPKFKEGTRSKETSGMAVVGEAGEEVIYLPKGSQVIPNKKYIQNKEIINAMFDNKLEQFIYHDYVLPEITKEKRTQIHNNISNNLKTFNNYEYIFKQQEIAPILIESRIKAETEKEQVFQKNIAQSFYNSSILNQQAKVDSMSVADYINAERVGLKKQKMAYAEYLAEKIAEKIKDDPRRT